MEPQYHSPTSAVVTFNNQNSILMAMYLRLPQILCLLHDNRIFAFQKIGGDQSSTEEQNLMLALLTTAKFRIMGFLYSGYHLVDNTMFLLIIILSILNNGFTMPEHHEIALFAAIGLEGFYDVMLFTHRYWILQRLSIFIGLVLYVLYFVIVGMTSITSAGGHLDRPAHISIIVVWAVLGTRFAAFILEELVDVAIDLQLHNDLVKLNKEKDQRKAEAAAASAHNVPGPSRKAIVNKGTATNPVSAHNSQGTPQFTIVNAGTAATSESVHNSAGTSQHKGTNKETDSPSAHNSHRTSKSKSPKNRDGAAAESKQKSGQDSKLNTGSGQTSSAHDETSLTIGQDNAAYDEISDTTAEDQSANHGTSSPATTESQETGQESIEFTQVNLSDLAVENGVGVNDLEGLVTGVTKPAGLHNRMKRYLNVSNAVTMPDHMTYVGSLFAWGQSSVFDEGVWRKTKVPQIWSILLCFFPAIPASLVLIPILALCAAAALVILVMLLVMSIFCCTCTEFFKRNYWVELRRL